MKVKAFIHIEAPIDLVWAVTEDIERWPEWTPTVNSVKRVDDRPVGLGSRVRIKQPGLPEAIWTVTAFVPNEQFSWETRILGMHMVATHVLATEGAGAKNLLRIEVSGIVAVLQWPLLRVLMRRALSQENAGLKRHCETLAESPHTSET